MKILFVSQEYPPETGWGGIGTYLGVIAPTMAELGADVHVLSCVPRQRRTVRVVDGVHVHRTSQWRPRGVGRISRLPESWGRLALAGTVALESRRLGLRPDVVESPEWGAEGLLLSRWAPLVVRLHSGAAQVFPYFGLDNRDGRLSIRLEEATIRRSHLVTGTRSQITTVAARLGLAPEAVREITYPVRPVSREPLPEGEPVVFWAGRFERRKGPETLVRAAPAVLRRLPGVRFVLAGKDTAEPSIASYVEHLHKVAGELGVGHAFRIDESWGEDVVDRGLRRCTVCAVPSLWESFGYVAAQAAARGRAVVASRIPSLSDVVEDGVTGLLVRPEDPEALSEGLIEVLSSPGRAASMGEAARRRMRERCDPTQIARRTLDAYEAAIVRSRRRLHAVDG